MSVLRSGTEASGRRHRPWLWVGLGLAIVVLCALTLVLPIGEWVAEFQRWLLGLGLWGVGIFALLFIASTLVLAPDWPLSIAAGFVYGLWAFPVVIVAATVAASLSFLAARYLLRARVRGLLDGRPKLAAIDKAVAEEGWKIVALLRLSPLVPFNLQNYVFGVTAVPFAHYVVATGIGIMPASAVYIYLGAIGSAARHGGGAGGPWKWGLFALGLLATAAAAILVARKAKAKLDEARLDQARLDQPGD
jgi:uncharacterized membrane protein YdjX (TVP38/TMEM64 family)